MGPCVIISTLEFGEMRNRKFSCCGLMLRSVAAAAAVAVIIVVAIVVVY